MCNEYTNNEKMKKKKNVVVLKYIRQDIMMVVIYCYLEKENYKVFKFPMNTFCYFEIGDSLLSHHPISTTPQSFKIKQVTFLLLISKTLWLNLGA